MFSSVSNLPPLAKIALFLGFWLLIWSPFAYPLATVLQWRPFNPFTPQQKLPLVAVLYLFSPLLVGLTCKIEGATLKTYGLSGKTDFFWATLQGISIAGLGLGLIFALEGRMGWIAWQKDHLGRWLRGLLPLLALALGISLVEELIFRGIFQTQLEQVYHPAIAALLSSSIFALVHLMWERKETYPQLLGLTLMGMVLVLARWLEGGSLGLAWGLHAGWIWGLASLDTSELLIYPDNSPQWITGRYHHPLAGISGIICLLLTAISLMLLKQVLISCRLLIFLN